MRLTLLIHMYESPKTLHLPWSKDDEMILGVILPEIALPRI
jgi:hypothetical protein